MTAKQELASSSEGKPVEAAVGTPSAAQSTTNAKDTAAVEKPVDEKAEKKAPANPPPVVDDPVSLDNDLIEAAIAAQRPVLERLETSDVEMRQWPSYLEARVRLIARHRAAVMLQAPKHEQQRAELLSRHRPRPDGNMSRLSLRWFEWQLAASRLSAEQLVDEIRLLKVYLGELAKINAMHPGVPDVLKGSRLLPLMNSEAKANRPMDRWVGQWDGTSHAEGNTFNGLLRWIFAPIREGTWAWNFTEVEQSYHLPLYGVRRNLYFPATFLRTPLWIAGRWVKMPFDARQSDSLTTLYKAPPALNASEWPRDSVFDAHLDCVLQLLLTWFATLMLSLFELWCPSYCWWFDVLVWALTAYGTLLLGVVLLNNVATIILDLATQRALARMGVPRSDVTDTWTGSWRLRVPWLLFYTFVVSDLVTRFWWSWMIPCALLAMPVRRVQLSRLDTPVAEHLLFAYALAGRGSDDGEPADDKQ